MALIRDATDGNQAPVHYAICQAPVEGNLRFEVKIRCWELGWCTMPECTRANGASPVSWDRLTGFQYLPDVHRPG